MTVEPARNQAGTAVRVAEATAIAAAVVGGAFALVSIYWGLGGSWLLDTVGGGLEAEGRAGSAGIVLLLWVSVALKLVAAVLPLATVRHWGSGSMRRPLRALTWASGIILTGYGGLLTAVGFVGAGRHDCHGPVVEPPRTGLACLSLGPVVSAVGSSHDCDPAGQSPGAAN